MTQGAKTVGVLMLETKFPRLHGDIGNPESFPFPILYEIVKGASPERVVREKSPDLLSPFIEAGERLIERGADILTTSCGFLIYFQQELQAALPEPIYTSSLLQFKELEAKYGAGNVGIQTISKSSLNAAILQAAGIPEATPIATTEGGTEFTEAILQNRLDFNVEQCRSDNIEAALNLQKKHPNLRALLLECTNMPPHSDAIKEATNLEIYSLNTLLSHKAGSTG